MGATIPQRDLRNHNAKIIERVIAGESFTVTRDGVPVADVIPHVPTNKPPMFPRAADLPKRDRFGAASARRWMQDIQALDTDLDQTPRDPWDATNLG